MVENDGYVYQDGRDRRAVIENRFVYYDLLQECS